MNYNTTKYLFIFALAFVCGSLFYAGAAKAQKKDGDIISRFKRPMPELPKMDDAVYLEKTYKYNKTPYGDEALSYSIRIPKGWVEGTDRSSSNFILSEKLFLDISKYYSPAKRGERSRIEIKAVNMEDNLTALQWYLIYILEGGYTTEGLVVHSDRKVESMMVIMEGDTSYYVRTIAQINGQKMILLEYYLPIFLYKEEAVMQARVVGSFELKNTISHSFTTNYQEYRFLDVAELKYPPTWKVYPKPLRSVDNMSVSLLNLKSVMGQKFGQGMVSSTEGKIDVSLIASQSVDTLLSVIENYRRHLESTGMLVGKKITNLDGITYNKDMAFAMTEIYEGVDSTSNLVDYELWFSVMVGGNYYFLISLLTPSRNSNFSVWAKNTQDFKEILKAFKPATGAFIDRDG